MNKLAYSIAEFCEMHNISRGTLHNLEKAGQAPRFMRVNARKLITAESAAEWRAAREAAADRDEVAA